MKIMKDKKRCHETHHSVIVGCCICYGYVTKRNIFLDGQNERMALNVMNHRTLSRSVRVLAAMVFLLTFGVGAITCQTQKKKVNNGQDLGKLMAVNDIIHRAGNAADEKARYQLLQGLLDSERLSSSIQKDLKTLLSVIDAWANGRENFPRNESAPPSHDGYLSDFFEDNIRLDNDFPGHVPKDSPLYPIWCMYRGRFLVWITIESKDPKTMDQYYDEARKLLNVAHKAFPENPILRMYLGEPIPWTADFPPDPKAPRWANLQREGLEKLTDIVHWWIDHRQLSDGQYGGGWGDDVEMWRWWTPLLIGFEDDKIIDAQLKLSSGILHQPHLKHGYTSNMTDVEHTAEDTSDALTPAMHLRPRHPKLQKWVLRLPELMRTTWAGKNRRGFLQFKSAYFNVDRVDPDPRRAYDTVFHPRALEPALLYWQLTGDEALGKLFSAWMDTWVDAASREDNGKPAGILPSAIHWPDGGAGGRDKEWWRPKIYFNDMYAWPSKMEIMTKTLLLTYRVTDDDKYLEPIRSMIRIHLHYVKNPPIGEPQPGTSAWCATTGGQFGTGMHSFLPETVAKLRALTGSNALDDVLLRSPKISGYVKMRLNGDRTHLIDELERNAEAFRINKPSYTSETRFTDRVLNFSEFYYNMGNGWSYPTPDVGLLYSALTGDPGEPSYFPMYAVRWLTHPRAFAALVIASSRKRFKAELYHFGDNGREMGANLYLLRPGIYSMTLVDAKGKLLSAQDITVQDRGSRLSFHSGLSFRIPPRTLCRLQVVPKN
jgi:hypothetical protein